MKVEVAAGTPITVYIFIFFAGFFTEFAFVKLFVLSYICPYPWRKENKRMDWVQGMVQKRKRERERERA